MKACATANAVGSVLLACVAAVAACSGSAPSAAPAHSPSTSTPAAGRSEPPGSTSPGATPAADGRGAAETRTLDTIAQVVKKNRVRARACYEDVLRQKGGIKGNLVVHFVLDPQGGVKLAELNAARSTLDEPAVTRCVIDVIRSLEFPASSRGMETVVNYPFNFNP